MNFNISDFKSRIFCDSALSDSRIETTVRGNELDLYISAKNDRPKFIELYWNFNSDKNLFVLGDAWERSYGNLEFKNLSDNNRYMPWYFIATDKKESFCFGVKTGCNSFVSFKYNEKGITAVIDCRNGGNGVHLDGRKLCLATFVLEEYDNAEIYKCLRDYCKKLCDNPILPSYRVYGGNNWYYAYGKSNYKQIISDAKLQVELSKDIDNKPFMVIDDCWQLKK